MTRTILVTVSMLAASTSVFAQTAGDSTERALAAAPRQLRAGATVIKWNADNTYARVKKGTNRLVCYDRSGEPGRAAFAGQCNQHRQPGSGGSEPQV